MALHFFIYDVTDPAETRFGLIAFVFDEFFYSFESIGFRIEGEFWGRGAWEVFQGGITMRSFGITVCFTEVFFCRFL